MRVDRVSVRQSWHCWRMRVASVGVSLGIVGVYVQRQTVLDNLGTAGECV